MKSWRESGVALESRYEMGAQKVGIWLFIATCSLALCGCSDDTLPQYSKLDRLRVLALLVDLPEIQNPSAGTTTVQLQPYLSDLGGTGTLTLEVQSCLDPGVAVGAEPTCTGTQYASSVQTVTVSNGGGAGAGTFGDPERTGVPASGAISVGLTIPSGILSAYSAAIQNNGVAYLIHVKATSATSTVNAFRRILLSTKTPNANPVMGDLLVNGGSLVSLPSGEVSLSFTASSTAESYNYVNGSGSSSTLTEVFETTWFITDGTLANPRTLVGESTTWKTPEGAASGRQSVVVGVLRDGRGGVAVLTRKF